MKHVYKAFLGIVVLMFVFNVHLSAQLFFKAGFGYGAGVQPLLIDKANTAGHTENVYASFGGNMGFYLGAGLQLNDYLDFEVDLGFQNGRSKSVTDVVSSDRTYVGKLVYLNPSFVFRTSVSEDLSPYGKLGLVAGMPFTKMLVDSDERKFRGGFPLGYSGAIGADFNLSDGMKIFAEIYHQSFMYKPKKWRDLSGSVYKFEDEASRTGSETASTDYYVFSYGAFGLNIGLKLLF